MSDQFKLLNQYRKGSYKKDEKQEAFLESFNTYLLEREKDEYKNYPIQHPYIFVIGAPRSGTTLLTQLISNTFEISYINNLAARFFLAPLHGMRFAKSVLGNQRNEDFSSDYARTAGLNGIHEFGYFWRYWLNKNTFDDITQAKENENNIDWETIKNVLATLQHETNQPFIFKNIYSSYHIPKFVDLLDKVIFISIERDEIDTAISILNARKKYNSDLNIWWSYQPIEYNELKDKDYWIQIAGQIHYLRSYYNQELQKIPDKNRLQIDYREMCDNPQSVIKKIQTKCSLHKDYQLPIIKTPPTNFSYRTHQDAKENRIIFREKFNEIKKFSRYS